MTTARFGWCSAIVMAALLIACSTAEPRSAGREGDSCSDVELCGAGLVCSGDYGSCMVPGKQYVACDVRSDETTKTVLGCACVDDGRPERNRELTLYTNGCGAPPDERVTPQCCKSSRGARVSVLGSSSIGGDADCYCDYDEWVCTSSTYGGCDCAWESPSSPRPKPSIASCDRSATNPHCCVLHNKVGGGDRCSCSSLECAPDDEEVPSCTTPPFSGWCQDGEEHVDTCREEP